MPLLADLERRLAGGQTLKRKQQRQLQSQVALEQFREAEKARGIQEEARTRAEPFVQGLESLRPGQLSPYSAGQYGSALRGIAQTYRGLRRTGLSTLSRRGFGRAPSGFRSSLLSTLSRGKGRQETEAYNRALQSTYGQGLEALRYRQTQQQFYDPTSRFGAAGGAVAQRYGMRKPGVMQRIGQGLGLASSIASMVPPAGAARAAGGGLSGIRRTPSGAGVIPTAKGAGRF